MYLLYLFLTAFLILSVISTNWPVKLYHSWLLNRLAVDLGMAPVRYRMLLSHSYAELRPVWQGHELVIRFRESSVDALRANSGLEVRLKKGLPFIMECYRLPTRKREWGDFKKWVSGDPVIDSQWLLLTPHLTQAASFWNTGALKSLLEISRQIEQVLISETEVIVNLRRFESTEAVKKAADRLIKLA